MSELHDWQKILIDDAEKLHKLKIVFKHQCINKVRKDLLENENFTSNNFSDNARSCKVRNLFRPSRKCGEQYNVGVSIPSS